MKIKFYGKIKINCTHARTISQGNNILIKSCFISPTGTYDWICEKCGLIQKNLIKAEEEERLGYYIKNPKEYKKEEKEFEKLLKKGGYL